ncbi:MAG: hypothetical protein K8L91_28625 [Anaerolineae bacterium]|nr:hypothetical protein [Anaerolineae bacterium]
MHFSNHSIPIVFCQPNVSMLSVRRDEGVEVGGDAPLYNQFQTGID